MRSVETTLVKELDRSLKEAWARRVLCIYSTTSPATLLLLVGCLKLTEDRRPRRDRDAAAELLRRIVATDCGLYRFCVEWCRIDNSDENVVTLTLREELLASLLKALQPDCQRLTRAHRPPVGLINHPCLSTRPPGEIKKDSSVLLAEPSLLIDSNQRKPPPC